MQSDRRVLRVSWRRLYTVSLRAAWLQQKTNEQIKQRSNALSVKNDVLGNVEKVRVKFESDPSRFAQIEQLVIADLAEHNGQLGHASEGLLWLKR